MNREIIKPLIVYAVCIVVTFVCGAFAAQIRDDFGKVEVSTGYFTPQHSDAKDGQQVRIAYKLYKPKSADASSPAAAVLAMHGYQNDKDTSTAYAMELARRGIVVLAIDHYGHGNTKPGMRGRGWGQYNIKNKVRNIEDDFAKPLFGPKHYKLLMTFSVLDFFNSDISSGVADSSMGGKSAWRYLSSLPFVDSGRMALTGHSMGTWASWSVAAAFPEHRAVVLQCGEIFPKAFYDSENIKFNNVLLLQAQVDEFENMRDYRQTILDLNKQPLRYRDFLGQDAPVEWDRTYGSFADGSARRMELIHTSHRLVTYDNKAMSAAMDWFTQALEVNNTINAKDHVHWFKELLGLAAMLAAMVSMLPLFLILNQLKFFENLALPLKSQPKQLSPSNRKITILTAILISGATFPFLSQLGHGLLPFPESIFRMTIGNGFITWLGFLMLVALFSLRSWYLKGETRKTKWEFSDLGLDGQTEKGIKVIRPVFRAKRIIPRAIIAALILTGSLYIILCIFNAVYKIDFRFIWPFFRPFSLLRLGQFFVYLPVYAAFFSVNAGVKLYGQLRLPESKWKGKKSPALTQLTWWLYSILVMLGGLFIIILIEYIPFFLGLGPGADLLFSSLFGGPYMSVLILLVPQFALFFFFSTWLYRKSGTIYTGSFVLAILATWVLTGGSAVF